MALSAGTRLGPYEIVGPVGALPLRKAVEHAEQAALGLAAARERGVVHRDLKPANLFVTRDGRLKVLDFGLARLTQVDPLDVADSELSTNTAEGKAVGTVGYMSPEQVRGHAVDTRSYQLEYPIGNVVLRRPAQARCR